MTQEVGIMKKVVSRQQEAKLLNHFTTTFKNYFSL